MGSEQAGPILAVVVATLHPDDAFVVEGKSDCNELKFVVPSPRYAVGPRLSEVDSLPSVYEFLRTDARPEDGRLAESARRAAFEQAGLKVKVLMFVGVDEYICNGQLVLMQYLALANGVQSKVSEQKAGVKWMTLEQIVRQEKLSASSFQTAKRLLPVHRVRAPGLKARTMSLNSL